MLSSVPSLSSSLQPEPEGVQQKPSWYLREEEEVVVEHSGEVTVFPKQAKLMLRKSSMWDLCSVFHCCLF